MKEHHIIFYTALLFSSTIAFNVCVTSKSWCRRPFTSKIKLSQDTPNIYKFNKFISAAIEERLRLGTCTATELDRIFAPSKSEAEYIERLTSKGYSGIIFSLEGVLVDLAECYRRTFESLAQEMKAQIRSPDNILDVIGCSVKDGFLGIGIHLPSNFAATEQRFFELFDQNLDTLPLSPHPGAPEAMEMALRNGDQVTIMTSLPRPLAVKALVLAGLTPILERSIDPSRLVHYNYQYTPPKYFDEIENELERQDQGTGTGAGSSDVSTLSQLAALEALSTPPTAPIRSARERERDNLLVRCCGLMRRPTFLGVLVDRNRRNIAAAKKLGLNVIGVRGKITRRSLGREDGPQLQPQSEGKLLESRRTLTASPVQDAPRKKDTFADEFGADTL
eukprot:gene8554-17645_t